MFRNYLVAAWRSARRDRAYSVINVLGLAVGLAAAILIALFVRHELTYDAFLTDSDQVYRVSLQIRNPGQTLKWGSESPKHTAAALVLDFPEFSGVARLIPEQIGVRRGEIEASEDVFWADPDFLTVMGLRTIAGDAATALAAPDGVVLTRSMARKYFGTDTPLGATLEFNRQDPMRVTAIIEDLPSNTHLASQIIAAARAVASPQSHEDAEPQKRGDLFPNGYLYVRLKPGASAADIQARLLHDFPHRRFPQDAEDDPKGELLTFMLDPVTSIHMLPYVRDMKERTDPETVAQIGIVGVLIIAIAAINFVNLMTARAARRAIEVGVRKALGATRRQLIVQFMGEAMGFTAIAVAIAVALVELLLPSFNAALDHRIRFAIWQDPELAAGVLALTLIVGLGAGFYPALVLSSFPPAAALKSARATASGRGRLRQALVVLQFAASIGLAVSTLVIARQTGFATGQSLRLDKDQVLLVRGPQACIESFRNQITALAGVRGAVCSRNEPLGFDISTTSTLADGHQMHVNQGYVDFGFFEFYGLPLLAGRYFDRSRAEDSIPPEADAVMEASVVINEAAMRVFGFANPQAAIGQEVTVDFVRPTHRPSHIIGVVPDFPNGTIRRVVPPGMYYVDQRQRSMLSIRLDGGQIPATLSAIDRIWSENVAEAPIRRVFLDSELEKRYRDLERQGRIFGWFSAVAVAIGCLGLFGLSALAAERRTKEIGIRKALGASTGNIVILLIWQFIKPVLLANAIAWPLTWWLMQRWLDGFAYRIELPWQPFLLASAGALAIAMATTGFHALQAARARPVASLRYE
jgi:putative ABC transport system permease protein